MINVGENYKVGSDRYNIILYGKDINKDPVKVERMNKMWEKRRALENLEKVDDDNEDKAEKGWRIEGYYSNVENCLNALVRIEVNKSDLKDLQTVLEKINDAKREIKEALALIFQGDLEKAVEGKL